MQVCIAESERKVAEMAWRDAASALTHAKLARMQAEQNWHEARSQTCAFVPSLKTSCWMATRQVSERGGARGANASSAPALSCTATCADV